MITSTRGRSKKMDTMVMVLGMGGCALAMSTLGIIAKNYFIEFLGFCMTIIAVTATFVLQF